MQEYSPLRVFLDIPYVEKFAPTEVTIWTIIYMHQLKPVLVREQRTDEPRLCRLCRMICSCKYGLADFSIPRVNVGFEFGLLKAWGKLTAVLIHNRYKLDEVFSDHKAIDPIGHNWDKRKLIVDLSDWLETNWEDSAKNVSKELIANVSEALTKTYETSYSYDKMNLFYEDLDKVLAGIIEQAQSK